MLKRRKSDFSCVILKANRLLTEGQEVKSGTSEIHTNAFLVLGVTIRDDIRTIESKAEERSLHLDYDTCQKARQELTHPRARLSAEIAWLPGVAPRTAASLLISLSQNPMLVRAERRVPNLARANLMAAVLELTGSDEPAGSLADFIREFAGVVELIDADEVLRDVNEDRAISGFAEARLDALTEQLSARLKTYRSVLRNLLDNLETETLVATMTDAVSVATNSGEKHGPALLDDLVDAYEFETQGFLQKEYENIAVLIQRARKAGPHGEGAVSAVLDAIELVTRNWDRVAQPIQVSFKSRGKIHRQSRDVAYALRELGVDLNNDHGMLDQAHRMTELLRELFAELPEVFEKLDQDSERIASLRLEVEQEKEIKDKWDKAINFRAEWGLIFKQELSISSDEIRWRRKAYPLNSITRIRWGGVNKSVNGIPTGTDYTIGFGDNHSAQFIELRKQSIYSGFVESMWLGVCVRLMLEMLGSLKEGRSFTFGSISIEDEAVTLVRHRFLRSNELVKLSWSAVNIRSENGNLIIGKTGDKAIYGSASYIQTWNAHVLEHIVRGAFKKGVTRLSDYLRD